MAKFNFLHFFCATLFIIITGNLNNTEQGNNNNNNTSSAVLLSCSVQKSYVEKIKTYEFGMINYGYMETGRADN